MSLSIVPLADHHLGVAAKLLAARYAALREQVPNLPARHEDVGTSLAQLGQLPTSATGVAAIADGRLVGVLGGFVIPRFRGQRTFYCPEWANGADLEGGLCVYEQMYARAAHLWVEAGCHTHLVSMLAHDQNGIERWQWLGFGLMSVDAVRDLEPVPGGNASVRVRRAGLTDIDEAVQLSAGLAHHLASGPTFVTDVETRDKRFYEEWLADPANALWLAHDGTRAVGCLASGPASEDASSIIRDPGTTSISTVFTKAEARCTGVGTTLLKRALKWARAAGYERCAVDFEPMNTVGARFWMNRFQPVVYTFEQRIG